MYLFKSCHLFIDLQLIVLMLFDCYVLNDITFNIYAILFNRRNAHEK